MRHWENKRGVNAPPFPSPCGERADERTRSPGEGEPQNLDSVVDFEISRFSLTPRTILLCVGPLPQGEGRGSGDLVILL